MAIQSITVMLKLVIDRILSESTNTTLLSLPEHVLEVRRLCQQNLSDVFDVEDVVIRDPAFCAYLMQLANSSLYSAGKQECDKLIDAIRRLGVHAVGETALVYALRQLHQIRGISQTLSNMLKFNWQHGWEVGKRATELFWQHRHRAISDVKAIDVSDIVTAAVLGRCGNLAVYTAAAVAERKGKRFTEEQLKEVGEQLNPLVLPELLSSWQLPPDYAGHLLMPCEPDHELHFTDYIWASELLQRLQLAESIENLNEADQALYERLNRLGVLEDNISAQAV